MRSQLVVASFALLLAAATGCATEDWAADLTAAPVLLGADDADDRAYDLGHHYGRQDDARGEPSDYRRHRDKYQPDTERVFAMGYRVGFTGHSNRTGFGNERGFYTEDQ